MPYVNRDASGNIIAHFANEQHADQEFVVTLPAPTLAQQIAHCDALVESLLDQTAQRKGYKNSDRLAGYANSTNPAWANDASIFIAWRDAVWSYCTVLLASVQAGTATAPTDAQLLSGLPPFNAW